MRCFFGLHIDDWRACKNGSFKLVEDDGLSYNYTRGDTRTTAFYWNDGAKTLSWKVSGPYSGKNVYKSIKVVLGKEAKVATIGDKGSVVFFRHQ